MRQNRIAYPILLQAVIPVKDWRTISCPIERTATLLADHYVVMIVRDLMNGPKRFTELERAGINPRTLSSRLRHLVRVGFVVRAREGPRPLYRLTDMGAALLPLLGFLREYGDRWLPIPES